MLIIRRIFHISTRCFSCAFAIDCCLVLRPFVAPLFYLGCARGVFIATSYRCLHVRRGYCFFAVFGDWYVFDVMIFFGTLLFFDFRRILARSPFVCVVSKCWLPINTFFSLTFPRCRRSVPMLSAVFSTFHVKHCCYLYDLLPFHHLFFTVSKAIFCGFCCLVFLILAC